MTFSNYVCLKMLMAGLEKKWPSVQVDGAGNIMNLMSEGNAILEDVAKDFANAEDGSAGGTGTGLGSGTSPADSRHGKNQQDGSPADSGHGKNEIYSDNSA